MLTVNQTAIVFAFMFEKHNYQQNIQDSLLKLRFDCKPLSHAHQNLLDYISCNVTLAEYFHNCGVVS